MRFIGEPSPFRIGRRSPISDELTVLGSSVPSKPAWAAKIRRPSVLARRASEPPPTLWQRSRILLRRRAWEILGKGWKRGESRAALGMPSSEGNRCHRSGSSSLSCGTKFARRCRRSPLPQGGGPLLSLAAVPDALDHPDDDGRNRRHEQQREDKVKNEPEDHRTLREHFLLTAELTADPTGTQEVAVRHAHAVEGWVRMIEEPIRAEPATTRAACPYGSAFHVGLEARVVLRLGARHPQRPPYHHVTGIFIAKGRRRGWSVSRIGSAASAH